MKDISCELQALRMHMDSRFKEIEAQISTSLHALRIELRAEFEAQLHEAVEKINARMDAQHHLMVALQVAILLVLIALLGQS
ncbi:hypothetical protein ABT364_25800 [Massilia sp. SR12]